jgi:hypothetical protein
MYALVVNRAPAELGSNQFKALQDKRSATGGGKNDDSRQAAQISNTTVKVRPVAGLTASSINDFIFHNGDDAKHRALHLDELKGHMSVIDEMTKHYMGTRDIEKITLFHNATQSLEKLILKKQSVHVRNTTSKSR